MLLYHFRTRRLTHNRCLHLPGRHRRRHRHRHRCRIRHPKTLHSQIKPQMRSSLRKANVNGLFHLLLKKTIPSKYKAVRNYKRFN